DHIGGLIVSGWGHLLGRMRQSLDARRERRRLKIEAPEPRPAAGPAADRRRGGGRRRGARGSPGSVKQLPLPMKPDDEGIDVPRIKPGSGAVLPPVKMLDPARSSGFAYSEQELERMSSDLERHLGN